MGLQDQVNGVYWAHLVACGYSQVPGIDFSENYSPVVNDITFCILLLMVLPFGYSAKVVDVKTAFLYGDLEEEIFMECPRRMSDVKKDDCIILDKCIYSLVQAACQYYKKAVKILKSSGFIGGNIHLCLYIKKSAKGIVYVALYVDDNLMIGNNATIDDAILALKNKGLVLKIMEGLQNCLSCKIKISVDRKCAWWGQSHLIKNLRANLKNKSRKFGVIRLPVPPSF